MPKITARELAEALNGKRVGKDWLASCPVHHDKTPSFSISESADGKLLCHCHAGCSQEAVIEKLKILGLWDRTFHSRNNSSPIPHASPHTYTSNKNANNSKGLSDAVQAPIGCTLAQYAQAKGLPVAFLATLGMRDLKKNGQSMVQIPYSDQEGNEISTRYRAALIGANRFLWKYLSRILLYGLNRLMDAIRVGYAFLVEGESDAQTLWFHGFPAIGIPGASTWKEEWADSLKDIPVLFLVIENDRGGEALFETLKKSKIKDKIKIITMKDAKDINDLFLKDPNNFRTKIELLLKQAIPISQTIEKEDSKAKEKAWLLCQNIASCKNILEKFSAYISTRGLIGVEREAKILFLSLISRFLKRPVSVAVKGPSAGGKSYLVEKVLECFPPEAFYALSAMSERALIYSMEDLKNRFLVLFEAFAMGNEFISYLIRSLLSEAQIRYETVESTSEGMKPRLIEREGPTGLLVTTTLVSLHPENETRLLNLTVADTRDQTKQIFAAIANDTQGSESCSVETWKQLQVWLHHSNHSVAIPYADELAKKTQPIAVRLRRDFSTVLNLIKAHAILHQANRKISDKGQIIAELDDYRAVWELIADLIAEGIQSKVSKTDEETVLAVTRLLFKNGESQKYVTIKELAEDLKLDRSSASRRVIKAEHAGYIKDISLIRGEKHLVLADNLPNAQKILPDPNDLTSEVQVCINTAAGLDTNVPNHSRAEYSATSSDPWRIK